MRRTHHEHGSVKRIRGFYRMVASMNVRIAPFAAIAIAATTSLSIAHASYSFSPPPGWTAIDTQTPRDPVHTAIGLWRSRDTQGTSVDLFESPRKPDATMDPSTLLAELKTKADTVAGKDNVLMVSQTRSCNGEEAYFNEMMFTIGERVIDVEQLWIFTVREQWTVTYTRPKGQPEDPNAVAALHSLCVFIEPHRGSA